MVTDDILAHYGVKGMRWGVRKPRNERERRETFGKGRQPSVKQLSDKELREIVNRLNMERQYAQLTAPRQPAVIRDILAAGATINAVVAFSRSPAGRAIAKALTQSGSRALDRFTGTSNAVRGIGLTEPRG